MRAWQFSKPKNPGFGINRHYYLSVLSSKPIFPPILLVINPKGEGGAVVGFGAPLAPDASKDALGRPMERGAYVVASKDRKTVLRLLVLSKEEAGFDPEPFVRSSLAAQANPELVNRIRATWQIGQVTFESHDPMVYPAIDFVLAFCRRLAELTDGVVADPVSQRYLLPEEVIQHPRTDPRIDAREVVGIGLRSKPDGLNVFSLGMQKLGLPEFEMAGVGGQEEGLAEALLLSSCQTVLVGTKIGKGHRLGSTAMPFTVRDGGLDRGLWEGIPCLELLPPATHTASEALIAWAAEMSH